MVQELIEFLGCKWLQIYPLSDRSIMALRMLLIISSPTDATLEIFFLFVCMFDGMREANRLFLIATSKLQGDPVSKYPCTTNTPYVQEWLAFSKPDI